MTHCLRTPPCCPCPRASSAVSAPLRHRQSGSLQTDAERGSGGAVRSPCTVRNFFHLHLGRDWDLSGLAARTDEVLFASVTRDWFKIPGMPPHEIRIGQATKGITQTKKGRASTKPRRPADARSAGAFLPETVAQPPGRQSRAPETAQRCQSSRSTVGRTDGHAIRNFRYSFMAAGNWLGSGAIGAKGLLL